MDTATQELRSLVAKRFNVPPDEIRPDTHFIEDLGADSLDLVEIVMAMEERLGLSIANAEAETVHTFGDALTLLDRKRQAS